jgi:multiple sugar transport system permease protein
VPVIISLVAVALIAAWLFNDNYGIINAALSAVGIGDVPWLSSARWAMISLIIATLWIRLGFNMVIYLAALQSIPTELYDAARVDGASGWRRFRHITWPLLGPTTFLLVIINIIYSLHVFDLIYVMTGGGPGFSTTVLVQYIYQMAFTEGQMGYASAIGVVLYLLLLVFTVFQWRVTRQSENV